MEKCDAIWSGRKHRSLHYKSFLDKDV